VLNKQVFEPVEGDISALVADGVAERRDLEFKRELPGRKDEDLKEFLADVTSFANTLGGDIVFGIGETDGVATSIAGIDASAIADEMLRLENEVRTGTEPRASVRFQSVSLESGRAVIVLRTLLGVKYRTRFVKT
jgi:predicted HTH transcriptional regulator